MTVVATISLMLALTNVPSGQVANGNHFYPGYCTWAAAQEARGAWGVWLPWFGDAGDWPGAAAGAGWHVSDLPREQSIAAMPRGVQGSGSVGHVAWVLAVSPDGSRVTVRSMNWRGYGVITVHELVVDGRIQFISPPLPDPELPRPESPLLTAD